MPWSRYGLALVTVLAAGPTFGQDVKQETGENPGAHGGADRGVVLTAFDDPAVKELVAEVVERHAGLASALARAMAAAQRAPQAAALPYPVAGVSVFLQPPETRTGPQRLALTLSQELPGWGRLALRERAALLTAAAKSAEVDVQRLKLVTEVRHLALEIAFLDRQREISEEFRAHLGKHEEIARARYSTGSGLGQDVLKLQAAITRAERELVEIEARRTRLVSRLNALRDRPVSTELPAFQLEGVGGLAPDPDKLVALALESRPELAAAEAKIAAAEAMLELAETRNRPGFKLGFSYTLVDRRDDLSALAQPPKDDGEDIFALQGGLTLPVRRGAIAAGIEEAEALLGAERQAGRDLAAAIRSRVEELAGRLPLEWRELRLTEDLLIIQAEESLESAQTAYAAGTLSALELLDATHVLFDARTAVERFRADYLISMVELEGAVGIPLYMTTMER